MTFDRERLSDVLHELRGGVVAGADSALQRNDRRDQGAYFTPEPLVRFAVRHAIESLWARREVRWSDEGVPDLRILDPAAGDGRFLAAAARCIAARCPSSIRESVGAAKVRAGVSSRCVALERNPTFAARCREALPGADVRNVEALLESGALGSFDLAVGNPPYIRSIRLGESDAALRENLRGRYRATSYGEWDLYTAFIEQTVRWLGEGGEAVLIVPSRWLTARSARELRRVLASEGRVRGIVDFGAQQVFDGATTYASAVFLTGGEARTLAVARLRGDDFDIGEIDATTLSEAPWRISVGRGRAVLEAARRAGPELGSLARIAKGAGTNADRVYVVDPATAEALEPELVRPCYRGRDVVAYRREVSDVRCIVPYRDSGELIGPAEMRAHHPRVMAHFERHRDRLEARERGRFRGETFYQFGRPQNLALLMAPTLKVIVPDVAREGRALLEEEGAMVLDSAYAVVPAQIADAALLLAVLNSAIVGLWLRETGIPLRGDYVRMKTAYLQSMPIPDPASASAAAIRLAVERREAPGAIDELVRAAYGVGASDWSARG